MLLVRKQQRKSKDAIFKLIKKINPEKIHYYWKIAQIGDADRVTGLKPDDIRDFH